MPSPAPRGTHYAASAFFVSALPRSADVVRRVDAMLAEAFAARALVTAAELARTSRANETVARVLLDLYADHGVVREVSPDAHDVCAAHVPFLVRRRPERRGEPRTN